MRCQTLPRPTISPAWPSVRGRWGGPNKLTASCCLPGWPSTRSTCQRGSALPRSRELANKVGSRRPDTRRHRCLHVCVNCTSAAAAGCASLMAHSTAHFMGTKRPTPSAHEVGPYCTAATQSGGYGVSSQPTLCGTKVAWSVPLSSVRPPVIVWPISVKACCTEKSSVPTTWPSIRIDVLTAPVIPPAALNPR